LSCTDPSQKTAKDEELLLGRGFALLRECVSIQLGLKCELVDLHVAPVNSPSARVRIGLEQMINP
jgi:hypothetical protein